MKDLHLLKWVQVHGTKETGTEQIHFILTLNVSREEKSNQNKSITNFKISLQWNQRDALCIRFINPLTPNDL
jgi:hypothetical protein